MGVYINGMETPRKCIRCPVNVYGRCLVNDDKDVSKATADAVRDKDCPLVPVTPHGRLVDADELFKEMGRKGWFDNADRDKAEDLVLAAPTVIPASEEDEW